VLPKIAIAERWTRCERTSNNKKKSIRKRGVVNREKEGWKEFSRATTLRKRFGSTSHGRNSKGRQRVGGISLYWNEGPDPKSKRKGRWEALGKMP